jgi:hypothetical protein
LATVIASGAKQSMERQSKTGLLRRFAPRNDDGYDLISISCTDFEITFLTTGHPHERFVFSDQAA